MSCGNDHDFRILSSSEMSHLGRMFVDLKALLFGYSFGHNVGTSEWLDKCASHCDGTGLLKSSPSHKGCFELSLAMTFMTSALMLSGAAKSLTSPDTNKESSLLPQAPQVVAKHAAFTAGGACATRRIDGRCVGLTAAGLKINAQAVKIGCPESNRN